MYTQICKDFAQILVHILIQINVLHKVYLLYLFYLHYFAKRRNRYKYFTLHKVNYRQTTSTQTSPIDRQYDPQGANYNECNDIILYI